MKKVILLSLITFIFASCNPGKSDSGRSAVTRAADQNTLNLGYNQTQIATTCQPGQSTYGTIYEQSYTVPSLQTVQYNSTFESRVKGLLSVTINPEEVGAISSLDNDSTGVRFQGTIKLDQSGQVVSSQSKLFIKVYDSFVGQTGSNGQILEPIPVSFNGSSISGSINLQTGRGTIYFRDQYGEVRFDGQYDQSGLFKGTVSYTNSVSVVQGQSPSAGFLGQFYIARCAFIQ